MATFKYIGEYRCICGKCYANSQAFNGHKARCKIYQQQKRGNDYDAWAANYKSKLDKAAQDNGQRRSKEAELKRASEEQVWLDEGHYCERCGKLITKRIGQGRFCSQSCANSHEWDSEGKEKISMGVKKYFEEHPDRVVSYSTGLCTPEIVAKANETKRKNRESKKLENENYMADVLPKVEYGTHTKGFQPRNIRWSYPEKFWKQVFENNNVDYIHGEYVHNERTGIGAAVYELDFLIDGKYDIEIDGGTHTKFEEVKEKDIRRDAYLTSLGYIVYRIPWINPVSIEKKDQVYQQIVDLFNFLGKELITKKD